MRLHMRSLKKINWQKLFQFNAKRTYSNELVSQQSSNQQQSVWEESEMVVGLICDRVVGWQGGAPAAVECVQISPSVDPLKVRSRV